MEKNGKIHFDMILDIDKSKTVSFTGHRVLDKNFDFKKLERALLLLVEKGYENFLIGMALGFDTACFILLDKIRKKLNKNINLIACVPCNGQDKFFSEEQKRVYEKMLSNANKVIILSKNYTPESMLKRNRFMVDNSSLLVYYIKRTEGGSYYTKKYAESTGVRAIDVEKLV